MTTNIPVLLVLEGTYPFKEGGVSTWAHLLCNKIQNVDFTLYSMNAQFEKESLYSLSNSIKDIIQVPLWSSFEPIDFLKFGNQYQFLLEKKENVQNKINSSEFCTYFKQLLSFVFSENQDMNLLNHILIKIYQYFERHDFKETMKSTCVWEVYKETIVSTMQKEVLAQTSIFDLSLGMQWIYRFLIPFSITNLPKTSVVHLSLAGFSVIPALIAKNKFHSKIILTEHGVYVKERLLYISQSKYSFFLKKLLAMFTETMTRFTYHICDKIVSVNQFNQKWERLYSADSKKLSIINNGIDEKIFIPGEKPEQLKNVPTVVAAARIFALKDIETMIQSCALVTREIPDVQYLVYGDYKSVPKYTAKCKKLINKLGLEDSFKLMGPTKEPQKAYLNGDISILTSISEGFPYTVLESMSCKIPVVATDVGGVHEALTDDCGILCKPKNPMEIANAVIKLLQDDILRNTMSENCRNRVLKYFTINKFISSYENLYDEVLKEEKQHNISPNKLKENDYTRKSSTRIGTQYQASNWANTK